MDGFLIFVGLIAILIGIISLVKPLHFLRITTRKMGAIVLVAGLVVLMVGASLSPVEEESIATPEEVVAEEPAPKEVEAEEPAPKEVEAEEPALKEVEEEPIEEEKPYEATLGEKNALRSALDYLNFTSFSYNGLVKQLEFEGFTREQAVYGVDNCGADWNEQAKLKAQEYLDFSSFSRSGLIKQLEFEGFTSQQAEYAVDAVGLE